MNFEHMPELDWHGAYPVVRRADGRGRLRALRDVQAGELAVTGARRWCVACSKAYASPNSVASA